MSATEKEADESIICEIPWFGLKQHVAKATAMTRNKNDTIITN